MEYNEILKKVNDIFVDVFEIDELKIEPETSAIDIEEWDSLNHIQLVVAIEKQFNIRFTSQAINNWKNVGDICQDIQSRINI